MTPTTNPAENQEKTGSAQELSSAVLPQEFFDAKQYCCFKALDYFSKKENGGISPEEIRADLPHYASRIHALFAMAKLDPWQHFLRYGCHEHINPSNQFDIARYLEAKATAMNADNIQQEDGPWDAARLSAYFVGHKVNPLEHYLRHAGTGPGEVAFSLGKDGTIPPQLAVPVDEQVPPLFEYDIDQPIPMAGRRTSGERIPGGENNAGVRRESLGPQDFFSPACYLQFKALHDFRLKAHGALSEEQIRQNIFLYASEEWRIFQKAHIDPWVHYREYGTLEGINPSNDFDTVAYLAAKAQALNDAGATCDGKPWDAVAVAKELKRNHLSALEHFLDYAGTGVGEVEHGLTEEGEIPEEFRVPDVQHVQEVEVATFENIEEQHTDKRPQGKGTGAPSFGADAASVPSIPSGPSAPSDPAGSTDGHRPPAIRPDGSPQPAAAGFDRLPEYAISPKKADWVEIRAQIKEEVWTKSLARRLILLFVVIPTLSIFFYLLCFASQAYISETKFAVRGQSGGQTLEGFAQLFSISSPTVSDSYIVLQYIQSLDMFSSLDKKLDLRAHYADPANDIWYRLAKDAKQDDLFEYWKWVCEASFDPDTSILQVRVKAFSPEKALAICEGILAESESLVNRMNERARKDALSQAEQEVRRAEDRIRKARSALHAYRERSVILDPEAAASGLYGLVNSLEKEVAKTAAELSEALTFMKKGSPRVRQLENRLGVLERKLADEKRRLAGKLKDGGQSLNDLLSGFQALALEEEFAQKQLTSAMTSLESARIRADSQTQYVEAFERPVLADDSLYPRPLLFSFIYMVTSVLLLGLLSLIIAAVREHAGF